MSIPTRILEVLENDMDETVLPAVEKAMEDGATWQWDPQYSGVAGLFSKDDETLAIAYVNDHDMEIGDKFFERYM